jgi:hypothetical protein
VLIFLVSISISFFGCFADVSYLESAGGFLTPMTVDLRSIPKPAEISKRRFPVLSTSHHATLTQSSQAISASVDPRADGSANRFLIRCFGRQMFRAESSLVAGLANGLNDRLGPSG